METERLKIIFPNQGHIENIISFYKANENFLKKWEPKRPPYFYSEIYWKENIQKIFTCNQNKNCLRVLLFLKQSDRLIGIVNFVTTVQGKNAFRVGYKLDEHHQGKGLMQEALEFLIKTVFEEDYKIEKIFGNCLNSNLKSIRLLEKLKFQKTGKSVEIEIEGKLQKHEELVLTR